MTRETPARARPRRRPRRVDRGRFAALADEQLAVFEERTPASRHRHERALRVLARPTPARGPWPVHVERREGARAWDLDGNFYSDFSRLPRPSFRRIDSVTAAEELSLRFGLPRWHFTGSSTEAAAHAVQAARASTGRDAILKVEGAFHGRSDSLMVTVEPPLEALGAEDDPLATPHGAGHPRAITDLSGAVPFNGPDALEAVLARIGSNLAAFILEPAMTAFGFIPPAPGYLERARGLTSACDALLIFDESLTGAALGQGGGTARFGVTPDIVVTDGAVGMTEAVAAAMPALRREAPPAGVRAMAIPGEDHERMEELNRALIGGCERVISEYRLPAYADGLGATGGIVFAAEPIRDYRDHLTRADRELAALAWLYRANGGVLTDPGTDSWLLSPDATVDDVSRYVDALEAFAADVTAGAR